LAIIVKKQVVLSTTVRNRTFSYDSKKLPLMCNRRCSCVISKPHYNRRFTLTPHKQDRERLKIWLKIPLDHSSHKKDMRDMFGQLLSRIQMDSLCCAKVTSICMVKTSTNGEENMLHLRHSLLAYIQCRENYITRVRPTSVKARCNYVKTAFQCFVHSQRYSRLYNIRLNRFPTVDILAAFD